MTELLAKARTLPACVLRARRVASMVPGGAIIEDGAVAVAEGAVLEAGPVAQVKRGNPGPLIDLGETTLAPALVNAHTHLELSHLAPPSPAGQGFGAWVGWLMRQPLQAVTASDVHAGVDQLCACHTAAVADVATRRADMVARVLAERGVSGAVQHEIIGYAPPGPLPDVPQALLALAGHALYSTSPENLRFAKAWNQAHGRTFSLHLSEHPEELEVLATGRGEFAKALMRGLIPKDFKAPGLTPTAWASRLGLLDQGTLAVHLVHLTDQDVATLAASGTWACLCPRSNATIGVGRADAARLMDAGVPVCLGTDSLASVEDLDLFNELRFFLQTKPPALTLEAALAMITRTPAAALGLNRHGMLAKGSTARFSIVPSDLEDALGD